jgi:hypothetical protein
MDSIAFIQIKSSSTDEGLDKNLECISDEEYWTTEYIVDRLFFEMTESRDDAQGWEDYQHTGQRKKYYCRAHDVIKMAAGRPIPIFVINTSDLTTRLKKELSELKEETLDYVVSEAVGRVCENVNSKMYHLTLKKCLGWRFEH